MLAFAVAIVLGSFLLFQIEPIIGKFILPWFGGGPGVWATCLLFFQGALVAGYAYAHGVTRRLSPRAQAWTHTLLLVPCLALLPVIPGDRWKPDPSGNPTVQILVLLLAVLGLPYLVLSATSPLIQEWHRRQHPGRSPYRLFALSNAGSLAALLTYPFLFEWSLSRRTQAHLWSAGCVVFAGVCIYCAWRAAHEVEAASSPLPKRRDAASTIIAWVGLPAMASVVLVATTNKLCLDLAAAAFLWVLPLALYLLSFILCFDHPRWYRPRLWSGLAIVAAGCVGKLLFDDDAALPMQIGVYSAGLFACCMFCHGELYRLRPEPAGLTRYYLLIAVGGALGTLFVAVVAPALFRSFAELPIGYALVAVAISLVCAFQRRVELAHGVALGVVAALLLAPLVSLQGESHWTECFHDARRAYGEFGDELLWPIGLLLAGLVVCFVSRRDGWTRTYTLRGALFVSAVAAIVAGAYTVHARLERADVVSASRNFFGVLTVFSYANDDPHEHNYVLMNGRTIHGAQFTDPARSRAPTTYYGSTSGVGRAIESLPPGPRRLGLVGLGAGTLAAYLRPGDSMRIYEINPQVVALARSRFTYLPSARGRTQIVMGDARLSMECEARSGRPPVYDLLALDAFTSDAIPVHLLTREAFGLYLKELAPDGILAVHISNRFFDLQPVVANLARRLLLGCVVVDDAGNDDTMVYETSWMLLSRNPDSLLRPLIARAAQPAAGDIGQRLWTDDYTSLWQVLR
ncbi:MAG TPA: fused MFS/spermidine synthase [Opitutaceae bacterium]|jgi:hypothetical protein|nr:fused MFS/spermidine synthase [Opitutaceae bacterium]